jgi:hypothetical protein
MKSIVERPILFSAEMVRAILDGRKTQTRRVMKPQPYVDANGNARWKNINFGQDLKRAPLFKALASPIPCSSTKRVLCPYGKPGDLLWVRETCAIVGSVDPGWVLYRASGYEAECERYGFDRPYPDEKLVRWHPSIHMPRWASRITLRITDIRVERLHEITEDDARAEGCPYSAEWAGRFADRDETAKTWFKSLWNKIKGPGAWDENPWVWVVSFERVEP